MHNAFLTTAVPYQDKNEWAVSDWKNRINHAAKVFISILKTKVLPDTGVARVSSLTRRPVMRRLIEILRCEKGANAIEYAFVASLIAIAAIGAFKYLGASVDSMLGNVSSAMG